MDEPIINPWIVLLIEKMGDLDVLANVGFAISLLIFALSWIIWIAQGFTNDYQRKALCSIKYAAIGMCLFGAACAILPSKMTCYKMLAAYYVTPHNIEVTTDKAVDLIERIAEAIRKGKENEA